MLPVQLGLVPSWPGLAARLLGADMLTTLDKVLMTLFILTCVAGAALVGHHADELQLQLECTLAHCSADDATCPEICLLLEDE